MTTPTSQQTQIIKLCQAMFNAAPGAVYLDSLANYLTDNNATITDLANILAGTSAFSYPVTLTNTEFAEHFVSNLVGGTVSAATHSAAVSYLAGLLDAGQTRGEVMVWAADTLAAATEYPEWVAAAAQFNNRVDVATYYSIDRAGGATDLGTLRAVIANVTDNATSVITGKAVFDNAVIGQDSDISGATVFADLNGNDFRDLAEPNTTTDIHGQFTLPDGSFGRLVASGGHDMTSNLPFAASFTAPPGSTVINPLTTVVQALVDQGTDIALAKAWVSSSLGLSASIDLTTFAPLNEIPGVNSSAAVDILAASAQANNLFTVTAKALTSVDATLDMKTAFAQVVEALAEKITSATSVLDLTDAALLKEVIIAAAGDDPALIASMVDLNNDLALLIDDNNTTIAQILLSGETPETMRSQILQVARITQGRETTALAIDIEAGNGLAAVLTAYTGTAFDTLVSHATIGDVDGDGIIDQPIVLPIATTPPVDPGPTADTTAPVLSASTPTDNATGVLVGGNLLLNFNEAIQAGTGNIVLRATAGDAIIETFNMATGIGSAGGLVSVSGTGVTINPFANLTASTQYYMTVASTAVQDTVGNNYAGISSTTALSFTTNADGTAPTLSASTPADNASAVAVGSNIVLTFSENVAAGTGNFLIKKISDGSTVATIPVGDAQVTFNGTTGVTINPTANLTAGTDYFVTMASGVITDTAGNPYAGIVGATTLNFSTVDTAAPTLSSSTPVDNATGALVGNNLVLTFNEDIALGTGNIVLKATTGDAVIETFNAATGLGSAGGTVSASGTGVTINPFANLSTSTGYYLTVAATAVEDAAGNPYAGISTTTALNFTTNADGTVPTLTASTPADNAAAVAEGDNIVLTFSENVAAGTGNFLIKRVSDNTTAATIAVGDAQVTFNGTTGVTINPTANLTADSYYVTMASGVVTDTAGNPYAGISLATILNFTTVDTTAPTLSASTPADNAIGRLVANNLVLTFNEAIALGTGNVVLKTTTGDTVIETFNAATGIGSAGGTITASGTAVTIDPFANLTTSTEYYLTVAATAVEDTAGNPYAGISTTTALSFTTNADGTAPTLSASTPADNAAAVTVTDNIVLTFSENVVAGSGNFLIKKVSDDSIVATIPVGDAQVTFNGTTGVTINPTANLAPDSYYVTMASGVVTDTAGNPYAGISLATTLNFTTVDTTAPTLSASTPADNATGVLVASNLVLTFNEAIALGTGDIVLKTTTGDTVIETFNVATGLGSAGGTVTASGTGVTLNPFVSLTASTEYYVTVAATAVEDTAGNPYAGISTTTALSFTTNADGAAPTLAASTPADGATAVVVSDNIVLTFNENVAAGTGNFLIKKVSDDSIVATIPVADAQVTFNGTTGVTINPTANLTADTAYYVTMAAGVVTDTVGNPYAGISLATTLNFLTGAAPALSSSTPTDNATGIAVGGDLVLTYSEAIALGTGDIVIKKTSDNSVIETFNAATGIGDAGGTVAASGTEVTINPGTNLAGGTEYYVTVAATAVKDTAGNPYAGISSTTTVSFTTESVFPLGVIGPETINGTAVADLITGTYTDGGTGTFNIGDIIAGNGGVDTLSITIGAVAITPGDSYWNSVSGIEMLEFDSTGAGAQTLTTGAAFNTAFTAAGVDLTMQTLEGAINIDMATTPFTGAATIHTTTIGAGVHTITTGTGAATVEATGLAAGTQNIKGVGLTTVNATINGAGDQTIGDGAGNGANLTIVNATIIGAGAQTITSTSTSSVTVTAAAAAGAQTIVTGIGNDTVTVTTAAGQVTTITTNAGNDTIVASLAIDLITGGLGADSMTGGGAADTFAFGADGSVIGTSMDIITDFNSAGADILSFAGNTSIGADLTPAVAGSGAGSNVQTSAGGLITFAGADNNLALKIAAVQADLQLDAIGLVAMFVDGANTYVYYAGTATGNLDDQLIQLSGITTLATITGGATTVIG